MEVCAASDYTSSSAALSISCNPHMYLVSLRSILLRKYVFFTNILSSYPFPTGGTAFELGIITSFASTSNINSNDGRIRRSKVPSQLSLLIIDWVTIIPYCGWDTLYISLQ